MSSRTQLSLLAIGIALQSLIVGCSAPGPAPTPTPRELTAKEILEKTASRMKTVEYLHFQMEMTGGTTQLGPGITFSKIEGDAARPEKISLKTRAKLGGFVVDVGLISVGGKQYLKNPLTQRWDQLQVDLSSTNLLDPEKGALTILGQARQLKRLPNEELDGAKVFHTSRWSGSVSDFEMTRDLALAGLGYGLVISPITASVLNAVPADRSGVASALVTVMRMVGMMVGLSALTPWGLGRFNSLMASVPLPLPTAGVREEELQQQMLEYQVLAFQAVLKVFNEIFVAAAIVCLLAIGPALFLRSHGERRWASMFGVTVGARGGEGN